MDVHVNYNRRMAIQQGVTHWTSALGGTEHATTKLGARFHFRGLFLRQLDFSIDELNFIVTYLTNETTISEQPWWRGLSHSDRIETASRMKMHHLNRDEEHVMWLTSMETPRSCILLIETASRMKMHHLNRGEEHVMWLTSMETPRSCILLYGNAEARPLNLATTPVLNFAEGSVVGNLGAPPRISAPQSSTSEPSSSTVATLALKGRSDSKWRRIKRENSLRKGIHLYNKIIISGPADFILISASDVRETSSGAADRLHWAKVFGLEKFVGCLRQTVFEPGTIIVREGHQLNCLYLIIEGECRASVQRDDTNNPSIIQSDTNSNSSKPLLTTAEAQIRHSRKFHYSDDSQLPVASLGPKSVVGDISLVLELPEPTTVKAVTTVNALSLSQDDFLHETSDRLDPAVVTCIETYDTLRFVLERVEIESKNEHSGQRLKIESLREALRLKQSSTVGSFRSGSNASSVSQSVRPQSGTKTTSAEVQLSSDVSLPSVVRKHAATNADTRKQQNRHKFGNCVAAVSGDDSVSSREKPTQMTRQQRKAARAFANLQHPVAGKSLEHYVQIPCKTIADESHRTNQSSQTPQTDDLLFLFPTMTKRRQLHGKIEQ
ncbi:hypothetical protein PHMEG_0006525 [Phytophthora megakarya]|uniref:Cyclic nucleotide-binding domain-containing protein n=1 Tax=Phytophthora megakarya TaxID=4795 RepID=A0A225WQG9_9STRA|nr:hypothetical protein PHMEG_0006525 [Phytophthora megakarya]